MPDKSSFETSPCSGLLDQDDADGAANPSFEWSDHSGGPVHADVL